MKDAPVPRDRYGLCDLYEKYCDSYPFGLRQTSRPKQWTAEVKGFWIREAQGTLNVVVRGHVDGPLHPNHENKEFMIDVVWESMADDDLCLRLVMEYEYCKARNEQEWDFRKILHAKAHRKVFVFEVSRTEQVTVLTNHLCRMISGSGIQQQPPEQYLLICHCDGPGTCTTIAGFLVDPDGGCQALSGKLRDVPW